MPFIKKNHKTKTKNIRNKKTTNPKKAKTKNNKNILSPKVNNTNYLIVEQIQSLLKKIK
ncbi:hypothetical protein [Candidatus Phytoplasma ziziphi]|uniref:hypothetical protein n=1 Tax=Candidatus Phytoplasma TaxID=33926 RepID=UPI001374A0B7|nr:hypothetical protein [Candidatus Phytoplasma ziziphi]